VYFFAPADSMNHSRASGGSFSAKAFQFFQRCHSTCRQ
jgi:hypothetical protein